MTTYTYIGPTTNNDFGNIFNWAVGTRTGVGVPGKSDTAIFQGGSGDTEGVTGSGDVGTAVIDNILNMDTLDLSVGTLEFGPGSQAVYLYKNSQLTLDKLELKGHAFSINVESGSLDTNGAIAGNHSWWLAGLAGAAVSAVWNYAMSSIFTWSARRPVAAKAS